MMNDKPLPSHDLTDIVTHIDSLTDRDYVAVSDVLDAFGSTALLPALMVPALLVTSPLSGIPFLSSVCGIVIALIALQLFFGRSSLWMPAAVLRRRVSGVRLHESLGKMRKLTTWLDRHTHDRLGVLTGGAGRRVAYFACVLCGAAMPFLEIIPFSSSAMGFAVLLLITGLLTADGVFIVLGFAVMACVALLPVFVYSGVMGLLGGSA